MVAGIDDPTNVLEGGKIARLPWLSGFAAKFVAFACYGGLSVAAFYSWTMTASGFIGTKLLPDNSIIGNWVTPYLVAFFVELGLLAFYLTVPYFSRKTRGSQSIAVAAFFALFVLTFVFSLFAITFTSQGENLLTARSAKLEQVNDLMTRTDSSLKATYIAYVDGLDGNAVRARRGLDESGVAKDGPIAKAFSAKSNRFREKFGSQLGVDRAYNLASSSNFASAIALSEGNYNSLSERVSAFKAFGQESQIDSKFATEALDSSRRQLDAIGASTSSSSLDKKGLVIGIVFSDLRKAMKGEAEPLFYLAMMIAALPVLLSVLCTMLLRVIEGSNTRASTIAKATERLIEETEVTERFAGVLEVLRKVRNAAWWQKRSADIDTEVQQEVSKAS